MKAKRKPAIADLYKKFEKAHATFLAIDRRANSGNVSKAGDRALERCGSIARQIARTPARNIDEVLLKLRATIWDVSSAPIDEIDHWKPARFEIGAEYGYLGSLRRDLLRLKSLGVA
jgi:hypothetical protein